MKKKAILITAVIFIVIIVVLNFVIINIVRVKLTPGPGIQSGFPVTKEYNIFQDYEEKILSLQSPYTEVIKTGIITYQNNSDSPGYTERYPFFVIEHRGTGEQRYRVLLCGSIHGDEENSTETLIRFISHLNKDPEKYKEYTFLIIPLANPWGLIHNNRYNGDGLDIARDFSSNRTQEALLIKSATKGQKFDLILDLHGSHSPGYFFFTHGPKSENLLKPVLRQLETAGYSLQNQGRYFIFPIKDGMARIPNILLLYVHAAKRSAFAHYFILHNQGRHVLTLEAPPHETPARREEGNLLAIEGLLSEIAYE